jgi:endonuclease/exonuclease/phosphatase (EEP) superfamily protein YafD
VQAKRITEILKERFGESLEGSFIVAGDFNCHYTAPEIQALLSLPGLENVVKRLPTAEQWIYYYKKSAEQFDYLLLSPALSQNNPNTLPYIERRGLSSDIKFYQGNRFSPQINSGDEASDHCAVFMVVEV